MAVDPNEVQNLLDDFVTRNNDDLIRNQTENPAVYNSVLSALTFIASRFGTGSVKQAVAPIVVAPQENDVPIYIFDVIVTEGDSFAVLDIQKDLNYITLLNLTNNIENKNAPWSFYEERLRDGRYAIDPFFKYLPYSRQQLFVNNVIDRGTQKPQIFVESFSDGKANLALPSDPNNTSPYSLATIDVKLGNNEWKIVGKFDPLTSQVVPSVIAYSLYDVFEDTRNNRLFCVKAISKVDVDFNYLDDFKAISPDKKVFEKYITDGIFKPTGQKFLRESDDILSIGDTILVGSVTLEVVEFEGGNDPTVKTLDKKTKLTGNDTIEIVDDKISRGVWTLVKKGTTQPTPQPTRQTDLKVGQIYYNGILSQEVEILSIVGDKVRFIDTFLRTEETLDLDDAEYEMIDSGNWQLVTPVSSQAQLTTTAQSTTTAKPSRGRPKKSATPAPITPDPIVDANNVDDNEPLTESDIKEAIKALKPLEDFDDDVKTEIARLKKLLKEFKTKKP